MDRFTRTDGEYELVVSMAGRRRQWVTGGRTKDGRMEPTYTMCDWWRVEVVHSSTGEVRDGWALGTKEDAFGGAAGMARCWSAGMRTGAGA